MRLVLSLRVEKNDGRRHLSQRSPMNKPFDSTFFREAVARLWPTFSALGFDLAVEHYDYLTIGTAYAEFRRRGLNLRLVWDSKEQALRVETSPPALQTWTNVESGSPPDRRRDQARLDQLASLVRTRFPPRR